MKKIFLVILLVSIPSSAFANVSISLDVEAPSGTLSAQSLSVTPCPVTNDPATTTISTKCALEQAGLSPVWSSFGDDLFLTSIGSTTQDFANNLYWNWWSDSTYGQTALNKHELHDGEHLLVALGVLPLRIVASSSPVVGATTTIMVDEFGFDASFNGVWAPSASSTVSVSGQTFLTDVNGTVDFVATSTDPLLISATKSGFLPADVVTVTPVALAAPEPAPAAGAGSGGGGALPVPFSMSAALAYLASTQNADGSYHSPLITDWTALAFSAMNASERTAKLKTYMRGMTPVLASVTDYERHAMALEALGINPYSGTGVDYITPITDAFDGTQIGDAALDNDDIFSLFPLLHAGYAADDVLIQKVAAFILQKQKPDGSWDASADMTSAAIQALGPLHSLIGVNAALGKAAGYLAATEQPDGGWGSVDATSWVQTAINGIIEAHTPGFDTEAPWKSSGGLYPTDALAHLQQVDGAVRPNSDPDDTRVWSTSYAVVALSGKSWVSLLQIFSKPTPITSGSGALTLTPLLSIATSTSQATSTFILLSTVSTSTPLVSTSTPQPVKKKVASIKTIPRHAASIAPPVPQTAAASATHTSFFTRVWGAITSFITRIL